MPLLRPPGRPSPSGDRQPHGGGAPAQLNGPGLEASLYRCFDHPEPFARAFGEDAASTPCGHVARQVMEARLKHVGQGLEFYYGGVLSALPQLSYILVETEARDAGLTPLS